MQIFAEEVSFLRFSAKSAGQQEFPAGLADFRSLIFLTCTLLRNQNVIKSLSRRSRRFTQS